jgi:hypothetical protein
MVTTQLILRRKSFAKNKWHSYSLRSVKTSKASENTSAFTISNEKGLKLHHQLRSVNFNIKILFNRTVDN